MNTKLFAKLVLLSFLLSSCASIMHGPMQTIDFSSQPVGVHIEIDGKDYGETPKSVTLPRKGRQKGEKSDKKAYEVKLSLDGYHTYELKIKRQVDGFFFGNILFGGIIGIIVDASNGSMYSLTPKQVIGQMNSNSNSTSSHRLEDGKIYFAVTLSPNPEWKKIGQLQKTN